MNEASSSDKGPDAHGSIYLFDSSGFESFDDNQNGFEQLCINYTHELLQRQFVKDFCGDMKRGISPEWLALDHAKSFENSDVFDLIGGRCGFLNLLNEESIRPKGDDACLTHCARYVNQKNKALLVCREIRVSFGIRHFAANVVYTGDFVCKNLRSRLPIDLQDCATRSHNEILQLPLPEPPMERIGRRPRRRLRQILTPTVWSLYKGQLEHLLNRMRATRKNYIRCIAPNSNRQPHVMEPHTTSKQLWEAGFYSLYKVK